MANNANLLRDLTKLQLAMATHKTYLSNEPEYGTVCRLLACAEHELELAKGCVKEKMNKKTDRYGYDKVVF